MLAVAHEEIHDPRVSWKGSIGADALSTHMLSAVLKPRCSVEPHGKDAFLWKLG